MADGILQIFSKAPRPGEVKKRLIPTLGEAGATELYRHLLRRTLTVACGSGYQNVELWCNDSEDAGIRQLSHEYGVRLKRQTGRDLGDRMTHALATAHARSAFAVLIGCDCPSLTGTDLRQAAAWLHADAGAVLGPALDGGYYLVGLRYPVPGLFVDIPWGTAAVLEETRTRLRNAGVSWHELPEYADIDRPEDLLHLPPGCSRGAGERT